MPTVAFKHDHAEVSARRLDVDGQSQPYTNNIIWAGLATGAGLPATVAPIGRTENGLPIGVQIIGPYLEDSTPIQFAQLHRAGVRRLRAARALKQASSIAPRITLASP